MKQKVVVIGHGYTSRLGVIRALGMIGYEVSIIVISFKKRNGEIDRSRPIDGYSKYVSRIFYCLPEREHLINLLLRECVDDDQKVVLFPDSDFSAAAIDDYQEKLKTHFLFPHINHIPGAVVSWMDKLRQKELAARVGLDVSKGAVVNVVDGEYSLPDHITYPCFLKPLATLVGAKTGVGRCDTESELRCSIERMIKRSPSISVLIEEYKKIDKEYALVGLSDGQTVHIPGIVHIISLASGCHYGVAKSGEIGPIECFDDVIEKFKRFVRETGFCGVFDIDFYESEGNIYFCEMNFRYGGSGYAYTKMNVNIPDLYVRTITSGTLPESLPRVAGKSLFINERMCLDDWSLGIISTHEFASMLHNCEISFVADKNDPKPEWVFRRYVLRKGAIRLTRKYLGR